jgi:flagellar assembly protein FliH
MFEKHIQAISVLDATPQARSFQPTLRHRRPVMPLSVDDIGGTVWDEQTPASTTAWETERTALLALIASADALQAEPSEELAALIAETVMTLVSDIVGQVEIDRDVLVDRAKRAAIMVSECDNARVLLAHPADVLLLAEADLPLTVMADPSAKQGSIRIDCSPGWIEHGTSIYLDKLRSELGLQECRS